MNNPGQRKSGNEKDEVGLLEAKSAAAFRSKVFKHFMTFQDARTLLVMAASTPETVDGWLDEIDECELISDERGVHIPTGSEKRRQMEFWDFINTRRRFVHDMLVDFNARVNSISDIGRMAVFADDDFMYFPFHDFNPESLVYAFVQQREGILATVSGVMGSGKTDFVLFVAEQLLKADKATFHVVTNIWLSPETLEANPTLHFRADMRSLLLKLCDCVEMSGHSVLAMDETAMFFSRREAYKKENIQFEKFIRLIRKYNSSMLLIDQMREGLPNAALELRTVVYHKEAKKKLHYTSAMGERNYNLYLKGIPRTSLGFDTKHMGYFDFNVNLEKLYEFIKGRDNPIQATRDYLDAPIAARPQTNKERILDFIEQNDGCCQKDVAVALKMKPPNVTRDLKALDKEGTIKRVEVTDGRGLSLHRQ